MFDYYTCELLGSISPDLNSRKLMGFEVWNELRFGMFSGHWDIHVLPQMKKSISYYLKSNMLDNYNVRNEMYVHIINKLDARE